MKKNYALKTAEKAKAASRVIASVAPGTRRKLLLKAAFLLKREKKALIAANQKDLREGSRRGLSAAMLDRLSLTPERIDEMSEGAETVARLPEIVGKVQARWKRPNGLRISKVTVPLGVIFIIYESRPNVTSECASLCVKSGNAVILRGGSEAFYSNRAIASLYHQALKTFRLPAEIVSLVTNPDRKIIDEFLQLDDWINLVIPRGGEALIRRVAERSRIPVIKHYKGVCHLYVDERADLKKSLRVILNAKCQRPATCNALETLLVHRKIAPKFLPLLGTELKRAGCEVRADPKSRKLIPGARPAKAGDFGREFLDKILAVRVVPDFETAVEHIQTHGSAHTDGILTENPQTARQFLKEIDSSSVMVNASTRFSDGFQYGFGAEIGISTDKIHARGPMGLEGLTSYKYIVEGTGQVRE